jgi:hypothetical protein
MNDNNNRNLPVKQAGEDVKTNLAGYPASAAGEDIYDKYQEEKDINPEDISELKAQNAIDIADHNNEKNFKDDETGDDLDVPGSELDDEAESVGSEDEENNYYSLGDDDNTDLDAKKEE